MTDVKTCLSEAQDKMDMATMYLEESLAHIRAGKADYSHVQYEGKVPLPLSLSL